MTSDRPPRPSIPDDLTGAWRRFGPTGPTYQIVAIGQPGSSDEPTMRVHVVETGENADVPLADILVDPAD